MTLLAFLGILLLLFSLLMLQKSYLQEKQEQVAFAELKAKANQTAIHKNLRANSQVQPYTDCYVFYEQNADFAAWLTIPNTKIDYPVMYTPWEPEYYLRRAFDGSYSRSGIPFIGEGGTLDSDCFIIYGHNLKNDTMFSTLESFADLDFWQENPIFTLTTITEQRKYEVFAAVETRVLYQDESGYRPYFQAGTLTKDEFSELVSWLKDNSLYDTPLTIEYGEQILMLITCSYHTDNGRFLVAARRIAEES